MKNKLENDWTFETDEDVALQSEDLVEVVADELLKIIDEIIDINLALNLEYYNDPNIRKIYSNNIEVPDLIMERYNARYKS